MDDKNYRAGYIDGYEAGAQAGRAELTREAATVPEGWKLVPDHANADAIVTSLYRRFKDWSKRGFGPEDVTWCEVKADVLAMLAAPQPSQADAIKGDYGVLFDPPFDKAPTQVSITPAAQPLQAQAASDYCTVHCRKFCQNSVHGMCDGPPVAKAQAAEAVGERNPDCTKCGGKGWVDGDGYSRDEWPAPCPNPKGVSDDKETI